MNNSNLKFLKEMNNSIGEIEKNCHELKVHLNNIIESEDSKKKNKKFKDNIGNLFLNLKEGNNLKVKQEFLNDLEQAFKSYYESILLIYENNFIKKIKESIQKLYELKSKIIIEFEPPKINSFFSDNNLEKSTSNNTSEVNDKYNYYEEQNNSNSPIENNLFGINDNSKSQNVIDNEKNKEIDYFCPICNKKVAKYLCDICNQLFCQECFDYTLKNDKTKRCTHNNLKTISDIKKQSEKGKMLYLNSLNKFIKSILVKSNYLFNNERIKIKSRNDSTIESIKRIYFKYPFLEKINDFDSEINFLKDINNILINSFNIENSDLKPFCICDMDKTLVNLIENLFRDDPNNYKNIIENVRNINLEEEEIGDYKDEKYEEKKLKQRKIIQYEFNNPIDDNFYYVINLIPKKNKSYNKQNITSFLINGIIQLFGIKKENIYLLFGEKDTFVNYFIKTKDFASMSLIEVEKNFLNEYERIYEYKLLYESLDPIIDKKYLDYRGNTICPNSNHNLFRGTEKYYPPYGWIGIGLKVLDIYEDNIWLEDKTKSSKWAIAYIASPLEKIKEILKNFISRFEIKKNKYKKHYSSNNEDEDIVLLPNINIAEKSENIIILNNKSYKIALMAKFLISKINEYINKDYLLLNPKYFRIYRILLKEI